MNEANGPLDVADRLGIHPRMRVLVELGSDNDVDDDIRTAVEERAGSRFVDVDSATDPADVALLWWRAGDGELSDYLEEMHEALDERGSLWLLTPAPGRPGHVDPAEIADGANGSGLNVKKTISVTQAWTGTQF